MKKFLSVITMFVCVFFLASCSCKDDEDVKVSLSIGDMNATTYRSVTMSYLDAMIQDKESFIVYVYNRTCTGCKAFKPILESVIDEKNLIIYAIEDINISSNHELYSLRTTPALALYKDGEIVFKTIYDDNKSYFDSTDGFKSFLDKYTYLPTMYYINLEQLQSKINNDESFIIYYSRSSCGDCNYLNKNYLRQYLSSHVDSKYFYVIETDAEGIRFYNGASPDTSNDATDDEKAAAAQWQAFKDQYGLSNVNNPIGHGVGYVPTLQYYQDGEISDMMVYFNDGEYVLNSDDTYSIRINASYYNDNPYLNQTVKYSEYKEKLAPFYNQKLETFLNTNLAKVD